MEKKIIILAGPSGTGKTTISRYLLGSFSNFAFSVSATTRKPRDGEKHGKDYYFLALEEFRKRIELNEFIEYEEVYPGLIYGTLKQEIDRMWADGKIPILDVDVNGALHIKDIYPNEAFAIFVHPVTIENLKKRLLKRGTESPESIEKRLARAEMELATAPKFDYILMNEDFENACMEAENMISFFLAKN